MSSRFAPASQPQSPSQVVASQENAENNTKMDEAAALPLASEQVLPAAPSREVPDPKTVTAVAAPPNTEKRARKRMVSKKGKACWVELSADVPRGGSGQLPKIMTPEEVQAKLKRFEDEGYDTRGFTQGIQTQVADDIFEHAQNRSLYPLEEDEADSFRRRDFRVRIPKEAEWKAYQNYLVEQKLKALGVGLGDDEEVTPQSASATGPSPMSRQSSAQYPSLPFSPPLPTTSAGSHGRTGSMIVTTFGRGPSPGHASNRSIASPISTLGNPRISAHMRHSTLTSPSSFPSQPTPPGLHSWSPQQYFGTHGGIRGGSPALPSSRPEFNDIVSPNSPFGSASQPFQFPQKDDLLSQLQQQQQQQLQSQLLQQQALIGVRPPSTLAEVPEDEAEDDTVPEPPQQPKQIKQAETNIAVPTPRGHRHNISQSLERGVQDADYHLEEEFDRQLNSGGEFSPGAGRFRGQNIGNFQDDGMGTWEDQQAPQQNSGEPNSASTGQSFSGLHQGDSIGLPQSADIGAHNLSDGEKTNVSEFTNPSEGEANKKTAPVSKAHSAHTSQGSNMWQPGHGSRTSKASISNLNADAKEFRFNPTASFKPGNFTFGGSNALGSNVAPFSPALSGQSSHSFSGSGSGFNVSAPMFQPSTSVPQFGNNALPKSDFNFSSSTSGPSFKPDAPVFQPGAFSSGLASPSFNSDTSTGQQASTAASSIFGNISFSNSDIIKPAKRSKAIPIVRPDLSPPRTKEQEDEEGADGRITRSDARQKRARRFGDNGSVAQFASPSPQPLGEAQTPTNKQPLQLERSPAPEDKENFIPSVARTDEKSKHEVEQTQDTSMEEDKTGQAAYVDRKSSSVTPVASSFLENGRSPQVDKSISPSVEVGPEQYTHKHKKTSSLSATAKPFEFTPGFGSGFNFGLHVTKPSMETGDIPSSPPRHASRSPATTFRHSDDGSYKTAPEPRKHPRYTENDSADFDSLAHPSYNEIDEVMKHMNEEGSDFGVERHDPSWDQSSQPQLSLGDFEQADLRPPQMRSDAPSPSPRRMYQQSPSRIRRVDSEITHDPFSDERAGLAYESPVHRLNDAGDVPVSDWDDAYSTSDEAKIQARRGFFDNQVDGIINEALQARLGPLEENLRLIQESMAALSARRSGRSTRREYSTERRESDADDEDDETEDIRFRNRSPLKDRKLEKIRAIVIDALSQQTPVPAPAPQNLDLSSIHQSLADLKLAFTEQNQQYTAELTKAQNDAVAGIVQEIASMKAKVSEHHNALSTVSQDRSIPTPSMDMQEFYDALGHMKASIAHAASQHVQLDDFKELLDNAMSRQSEIAAQKNETFKEVMQQALARQAEAIELGRDDFKVVMEEALGRQLSASTQSKDELRELIDTAFANQDAISVKRQESGSILENEGRVVELEAKLKDMSQRLNEEIANREHAERREGETLKLLKLAEEELSLLKVSARDDSQRARALSEEVQAVRLSIEAHKAAEDELSGNVEILTAENNALKETLEEYRLTGKKWREDIQHATAENERIKTNAEYLKLEVAEAIRLREGMRSKLNKLQEDMVAAASAVTAEKESWRRADEEHRTKYEVLRARIEAEARTRERLELELERLESQEREGMKLRVTLEQTQHANARLEETVNALRLESQEHQKTAARYEREFRDARETGRNEVQRTKMLMQHDIDSANHQVNIIRSELESEIARARAEIDNVRMDADTAKARHELLLEEEADRKKQALHEAQEARNVALKDQQERFEHRLEELRRDHSRHLENAVTDHQRTSAHLTEKLELANSKMDHFKERIQHLEEQLSVAKEAAQAAAQAASKSGKAPAATATTWKHTPLGQPEKVSPQALRESIVVLQEQLQQRESRIESLEHELSEVDTEAPAKLKERDTEIGWLRELLGVRLDDLTELINALGQPNFNRETVRDAAIRLRTNLQMEQQEKERLISGSTMPFQVPSLASLSNLATPKAAQLAAAIGNWRKGTGRDSRAGSNASTTRPQLYSQSSTRTQTPSKASPSSNLPPSTQSLLTGLMTPPASNIRRTSPQPESATRAQFQQPQSGQMSAFSMTGRRFSPQAAGKQAPQTPPLLRRASYDQDAEDGQFSTAGFYDDEESAGGAETAEDERSWNAFGPAIDA
jgi:hypothetical protein